MTVPQDAKSFVFTKDQEGRGSSLVGCCLAGNPIQWFPDAAQYAAFCLSINRFFDSLNAPG